MDPTKAHASWPNSDPFQQACFLSRKAHLNFVLATASQGPTTAAMPNGLWVWPFSCKQRNSPTLDVPTYRFSHAWRPQLPTNVFTICLTTHPYMQRPLKHLSSCYVPALTPRHPHVLCLHARAQVFVSLVFDISHGKPIASPPFSSLLHVACTCPAPIHAESSHPACKLPSPYTIEFPTAPHNLQRLLHLLTVNLLS